MAAVVVEGAVVRAVETVVVSEVDLEGDTSVDKLLHHPSKINLSSRPWEEGSERLRAI
jgi:hypothetical protein